MLKDSQTGLYCEEYFNELLTLEKKRCKQSERPVLFMLADLSAFTDVSERQKIAQSMMDALSYVTRDTDVKGWHVDNLVIGIMFTEITSKETTSSLALRRIANKCSRRLEYSLGAKDYSRIHITWQLLHSGHILDIHKISNG
jgi:hypothetical protein